MVRRCVAVAVAVGVASVLWVLPAAADEWLKLDREASSQYQRGHYREAQQLAEQALAAARQYTSGALAMRQVNSLNALALALQAQGDYQSAQQHLLEAQALLKTINANDQTTSQALARNLEQALARNLELVQQDLQQQQTAQEAQQAEVINEQALAHHERGEYAEAAALYQQALALVEKHLGNTDITGGETIAAAHIHSGLADTYAARKLYPEAISAYKRALAIYQARNEAAAAQASALNGLAIIYYMERNFTEAEPLFVQALALLGGEQGEDTQAMLPVLDNLVALYTSTGRRAQAQPLRKRAAELRKQ